MYSEYAYWFADRVGLPEDEDALEVGEFLYRMRGSSMSKIWQFLSRIAVATVDVLAWRKAA